MRTLHAETGIFMGGLRNAEHMESVDWALVRNR